MNVSRTGAKPCETEILSALAAAVDAMDEVAAVAAARDALSSGLDAYVAITHGLSAGMALVSDKYEKGIYFVPEILLCADAMYAAIDVLKPHVKVPKGATRAPVIIGVIEGDIHDIGKSIVKLMLESAGFTVHDLGGDVPVKAFIAKARELGSGIIAVSTLMSTTMPGMARLIEALKAEGLRDSFKVMIGGGPVSNAFARKIGADAYGANAMEGVRIAMAWQEARP
jgi:corrinoid protein of di/trimethylamine methyltransferase